MIKKSIKALCFFIAYIWSFIYNPQIKYRISCFKSSLYYWWIYRFFKELGGRVYFVTPTYLAGMKYMRIQDEVRIGRRVMLVAHPNSNSTLNPEIFIGKNCDIGDDCNIQCCNSIRLGKGVLLGRKVMINDTSHGSFLRNQLDLRPSLRPLLSKGPIVVDDNVWIGEMVCILGNVHIGKGAIIGAGAIVTKDIPPYSLAVGCPAKVVKSFEK